MKKQYHLNTGKYRLQKFKKSIEERRMIPSRIILKEKIKKRFKILESSGIDTLKDLIDVLKTKDKIEVFSRETGLSVEYLTILKRESGSYLPNPIILKKFPGIDATSIEALEKTGIKNTKQFFIKINTEKQKTDILPTGPVVCTVAHIRFFKLN